MIHSKHHGKVLFKMIQEVENINDNLGNPMIDVPRLPIVSSVFRKCIVYSGI